jgi:glycosyltransferase involved in cell wall biosynthesis
MRICVLNVFYPPKAFGGATIVADQTARLLAESGDSVLVITADLSGEHLPGSLYRYEWEGVPVITVAIPPAEGQAYRNETFASRFAEICDAFKPDVVLTHAIQGLGASFLEHCESAGIASVIFVHDAWWLCERQFMITQHGFYCHQSSVSHDVCRFCVVDPVATARRDLFLRQRLLRATRLLFPSAFFRDLHVASGYPAERCQVVKNGVRSAGRPKGRSGGRGRAKVRFGFVGGVGPMKGSESIRQVFKDLKHTNYDLVCVDNMTNLGVSSCQYVDWRITGRLRIRPAYTQSTIDDFFDEIDVLLFPSQVKESFGLVVREALIRHKWVITSNGGGTIEDVVDGVNGRIIPLGQHSEQLADAVHECFQRSWDTFHNPYAGSIVTFESQATQLQQCMRAAIDDVMTRVTSECDAPDINGVIP